MEAKVKDNARFKKYCLFDSNEFLKSEWRPVPAGFEEQARAEKLLDIREAVQDLPKAVIVEKLPPPVLPAETYEYMQEKEPEKKPEKKDKSYKHARKPKVDEDDLYVETED